MEKGRVENLPGIAVVAAVAVIESGEDR